MRNTSILQIGWRRRRNGGAAIIEMVISFMVLFYLVMGGVEFGWFLFAKHVVQSAARDGARAAIISTTTHAQANAAVNAAMSNAGFGTGYTTTYQRVTTSAGGTVTYTTITNITTVPKGEGVRVSISAPFSAFHVRPLGVIPATKTLTGVTTMVKE
jgi:Flp pilus assembly protein TadG